MTPTELRKKVLTVLRDERMRGFDAFELAGVYVDPGTLREIVGSAIGEELFLLDRDVNGEWKFMGAPLIRCLVDPPHLHIHVRRKP